MFCQPRRWRISLYLVTFIYLRHWLHYDMVSTTYHMFFMMSLCLFFSVSVICLHWCHLPVWIGWWWQALLSFDCANEAILYLYRTSIRSSHKPTIFWEITYYIILDKWLHTFSMVLRNQKTTTGRVYWVATCNLQVNEDSTTWRW